ADLIRDAAPDSWAVYGYPIKLPPFDDASKPIAVVVEQRSVTSGAASPDGQRIPVELELLVWVVVDGARGDSEEQTEDELEAAAEAMIRLLEPLPTHTWNGAATRTEYDPQKPAYQFVVALGGALTEEEEES